MEMIVVMVIISLMMGFAVPRLDGFLSKDRSKKAVRQLTGLVKNLRLKSRKNKKDYFLVVSPSQNEFWVESVKGDDKTEKISLEKDSVSITGAQVAGSPFSRFNNVFIRFYKKGYNDPFVIALTNEKNNKISSIAGHPFLYPPEIHNKLYFLNRDG